MYLPWRFEAFLYLWGGTFASNIMIDQIPAAEFYLIQGNAVLFSEGSRDLESHG